MLSKLKLYNFLLFLRTRYITEVAAAYTIAFILSLGATIANFLPTSVLDDCDFWRPRFGENKCFYSGKFSWIWLGFKCVIFECYYEYLFFLCLSYIFEIGVCSRSHQQGNLVLLPHWPMFTHQFYHVRRQWILHF